MRLSMQWSIMRRYHVCLSIYAALCLLSFIDDVWHFRLSFFLMVLFAVNTLFFFKVAYRPLQDMDRKCQQFNLGYDPKTIFMEENHFIKSQQQALQKVGLQLDNHQVIKMSNRQAQYLALQNQINPHFLYNTLEAIRGDALSEGLDHIAEITEALATFFRYTISNVDNLVTLEEELNNAENYFSIQNYRFGDKIGMEVEVETGSESVWDYQIPKLTLQPIIENAIIHGLEYKVGHGTVSIHISSDGHRLMIAVTDDGVGMTEDQLEVLNSRLDGKEPSGGEDEKSRHGGIAISNVNNRIKLLFGESYGLRISSIKGFGTRVDIALPAQISTDR